MTAEQAVFRVAEAMRWDEESTYDLGLMLWALFRYYAHRAAEPTDIGGKSHGL